MSRGWWVVVLLLCESAILRTILSNGCPVFGANGNLGGDDRFVTTCWGETDYGKSTEIRTSINVHGMGCVLLGYGIWGVGVLF